MTVLFNHFFTTQYNESYIFTCYTSYTSYTNLNFLISCRVGPTTYNSLIPLKYLIYVVLRNIYHRKCTIIYERLKQS